MVDKKTKDRILNIKRKIDKGEIDLTKLDINRLLEIHYDIESRIKKLGINPKAELIIKMIDESKLDDIDASFIFGHLEAQIDMKSFRKRKEGGLN